MAIKARSEFFLEHYFYSNKIVFIEVIVAGMLFWAKTRERGLSMSYTPESKKHGHLNNGHPHDLNTVHVHIQILPVFIDYFCITLWEANFLKQYNKKFREQAQQIRLNALIVSLILVTSVFD